MDFQQISTLFLNKSVKGSYISVLRKSQSIYINAEAISPRRLYKLLIKTFCIGSRSGWQCHLLSRAYANFAKYICCDILALAHLADSKGTDSRSSGEVFLFHIRGFSLGIKIAVEALSYGKTWRALFRPVSRETKNRVSARPRTTKPTQAICRGWWGAKSSAWIGITLIYALCFLIFQSL